MITIVKPEKSERYVKSPFFELLVYFDPSFGLYLSFFIDVISSVPLLLVELAVSIIVSFADFSHDIFFVRYLSML